VKLKLLDLFCGAGGAAMGYARAGFEIVGVDVAPQPRYPFRFVQADAMTFSLEGFDAVHASPPCQAYSRLRHLPWLKGRDYPALLEPTWKRLQASGVPWVIENVEDAPMPWSVVLCGVMFNLPVYRHRRFGSSFLIFQPPHKKHRETLAAGHASMAKRYRSSGGVAGVKVREISRASIAGHQTGALAAGRLMDIDWMRRDELTQAIPPAYTEWIGARLREQLA
jgi:DNA (cytosine-5)-methyltransferase 1